jgi:hypothetical protein
LGAGCGDYGVPYRLPHLLPEYLLQSVKHSTGNGLVAMSKEHRKYQASVKVIEASMNELSTRLRELMLEEEIRIGDKPMGEITMVEDQWMRSRGTLGNGRY